VYDVVVLTLASAGETCGLRAPVRGCLDAFAAAGAKAEAVTAGSDPEIDEALARDARLVVATAVDGQLRAVVRRMVRRAAPAPSQRPADLPEDRTIPDLPPLAVLPMGPGGVAERLGLPTDPAEVAAAALGDRVRRLDLLRHDGGSVTLDGTLLGSSGPGGQALPWRARVEVDDAVLSTGQESLLAAVVANAGGYAEPDGLPLVTAPDPADGLLEVAVALPVRVRWRRRVRVEVRRARGRAVTVAPVGDGVGFLDDGVAGTLTRPRSWWVEPSAWAVYTG